jgi:hypothetical protein
MQVAQRGTAAVTTSGAFPVDRFKTSYNVTGGAFTAQQSTTAPEGFKNSTKFEVTTTASAGASEVCAYFYALEGQDMQQADFGLSSAKSLTASFWVRSSLTGTYSVAMRNNDGSRSYIAEYTVSSANTWEKKTVTFPGTTDGTWATDNTVGASLTWDLGSGSDRQGTAGSWLVSTNDFASSNNVNWCNTSSATWYITGVQLEVGSVATPFEHRSYGDELARCQRYYNKWSGGYHVLLKNGLYESARFYYGQIMRDTPTINLSGSWFLRAINGNTNTSYTGFTYHVNSSSFYVSSSTTNNNTFYSWIAEGDLSASAEL